jgi:hypothetical protein
LTKNIDINKVRTEEQNMKLRKKKLINFTKKDRKQQIYVGCPAMSGDARGS